MKQFFKILLLSLACICSRQTDGVAQTLYVGGDISVLQNYEDKNVAYYDQSGARISDVLKYLKSDAVGWNAARVRLFVNPKQKNSDGETDVQVCQDLDYVVRFCKRLKAEGFAIMLDFHYSDTWADPANQWIPADWASLSNAELQTRVYDYTKECLQRLSDEGAAPDFIQTGNEISYGMLWSATVKRSGIENICYANSSAANWSRFVNLLTQASKACREVCPNAKIIIHTERAGNQNSLKTIYNKLSKVDYDIIGLSYYPFWHNSLNVLGNSLSMLAQNFPDKPVQIVETAYYYQWQPSVGNGITYDFSSTWPITSAGQAAYARDLVAELKTHSNVNGLYWWFPEENGNGPSNSVLTSWVNRGLWNNSSHKAMPALYVLKAFAENSDDVRQVAGNAAGAEAYDLQGRKLSVKSRGIVIERTGAQTRKVLY
ncbi:MAG: arabinogalactan endo-1,4-beta-galactosidase [Bacteroidaceae bacterium]|nr:arabinogalactan endo-1,4-beta-galactosidase [Bacteroidaceae bacterium]